MLLAVAEHLTSVMTRPLEASAEPLTASETCFVVNSYCLLSEIYHQRQVRVSYSDQQENAEFSDYPC